MSDIGEERWRRVNRTVYVSLLCLRLLWFGFLLDRLSVVLLALDSVVLRSYSFLPEKAFQLRDIVFLVPYLALTPSI